MIGRTISHYKILEKLGEGAMGVVYKALDTTLDRVVALKFVSTAAVSDESTRERLAREAKACAALNHPNIMTVYEFARTDEHDFIAMEFVEGRTLQAMIGEKRFELPEVLETSLQVLDGLKAAHDKGIVHRDLKASNIMLDPHGRPKIMDFGLAKLAQASVLTQSGSTVGTIAYMSPEQARGEEADHRSDIYSMGVLMYQMLTGQLPFPYPHHLAVMYAVINEDPKAPRGLNPEIPSALEQIVLTAMAKDPGKRFQECAEMAARLLELDEALAQGTALRKRFKHVAAQYEIQAAVDTGWMKPLPSPRARLYRYAVLGLVVLLGIGFGLMKLLQSGESEGRKRARAHVEQAISHINANDVQSARNELALAIQSDSTYSNAWATLAGLNSQLGRYDLAIEQGRRAVALDENSSSAMYNLAYPLEEVGDSDEAMLWYAKAIERDSSFDRAYSALGNLLIAKGRPQEAITLLLTGEIRNPGSEYGFLLSKNLGKAYLAMRKYEDARSALERSYMLRTDFPETLFLLATAYEALSLMKESAEKWRQYASVEKDSGKRVEALRHIDRLKGR
ncbi:MAG: tetratricopeptide repeat protein [Ignavibacteria bacterium]|nr:tetratricopeptide repeat protein [Ignavibacteria bacterium]